MEMEHFLIFAYTDDDGNGDVTFLRKRYMPEQSLL